MSIKIDDPNNEGQEIEVFTQEELAAKETELATARAEAEATKVEVEKYKRVASEQTANFKKVNEMSEAERATFSAKEIEMMKRNEAAEAKASALEAKINEDTTKRIETDTKNALAKYHGGDEKLKEILEKNFKMINLEGNDTETIIERARLAAAMEAGKTGRANPLMSPMNGSSPRMQDKSKSEEFLKSEKAKAAMKMMGESDK